MKLATLQFQTLLSRKFDFSFVVSSNIKMAVLLSLSKKIKYYFGKGQRCSCVIFNVNKIGWCGGKRRNDKSDAEEHCGKNNSVTKWSFLDR